MVARTGTGGDNWKIAVGLVDESFYLITFWGKGRIKVTGSQKRIAAGVAVATIAALVTLMTVFAAAAATGNLIGGAFLGDLFLSLCANFGDLQLMLKGLGLIVVAGAGFLGATCVKARTANLVVAALAVGIVSCISLIILLSSDDLARNIYQPSSIGGFVDDLGFRSAAKPLAIWTGVAFVACLGAFLGLSGQKGGKSESA